MMMVVVVMWCIGIDCPRGARSGTGGGGSMPADEYGEEALTYTRDLVLQREVCLGSFFSFIVV